MYCCVLRPSLEQLDKLIFCECKTNEKEAYAIQVKYGSKDFSSFQFDLFFPNYSTEKAGYRAYHWFYTLNPLTK